MEQHREATTKEGPWFLWEAECWEVRYFCAGVRTALLPAGYGHLEGFFALWELSFLINKRVSLGSRLSKASPSPAIC